MVKRYLVVLLLGILTISLIGCDQLGESEYQIWRNSEDAEDLNGDRKIDELDYEIYLALGEVEDYETWRTSENAYDYNEDRKIDETDFELYLEEKEFEAWLLTDDAEDLNGDRKIDVLDYELFLSGAKSEFELWLESNEAVDVNEDGTIDEADYDLFIQVGEFAGTYTITNYTYEGNNYFIGEKLYLKDFGTHLDQMTFTVDEDGVVIAEIPSATIALIGDDFAYVIEGLNNMSLTRISPLIVGLDTFITIDGIEFNVTVYLTETTEGFTTSYIINYNDRTATITFDLIKGQ